MSNTMRSKTTGILVILVLMIFSCESPIQKSYEVIDNNESDVMIDKDSHAVVGEETCINISNKDSRFKIESAYIDCTTDSVSDLDIETKKVNGCSKRLYIENDTVMICFKPMEEKEYVHNVVLLLSRNQKYYLQDTSFIISAHKK